MQVQVQSGDTLDSLLSRYHVAAGRRRRATDEVVDLNGLETGALTPGATITIPDEFVPPAVRNRYEATHAAHGGDATAGAENGGSALSVRSGGVGPRRHEVFGARRDHPVELTPAMQEVVADADEVLNLRYVNKHFNPLESTLGRFKHPSEMFQGKALVDVAAIVSGAAAQLPEPARSALAPHLEHLGQQLAHDVALRTPAHQYNVHEGRAPGNRVVFYGEPINHTHIDTVVQELGKQHMRLIKQMAHFSHGCQGGATDEILSDGVAGVTHAGGLSAGYLNGEPASIRSDWPSDYGALDEGNVTYNANLIAIDYASGARDPIPQAYLAAYKANADRWDCIAGALVPFTGSDPDPRYQDYTYNPLEVYDQASAQSVAKDLAQLDSQKFLNNHGSFYCAEGQYCVANLGPNTLMKKSIYGDTPLGRLIEKYKEAPGLTPEHPEIGWAYLKDSGLVTSEQYEGLVSTDRLATYLDWIPEDVQPWTAFRPYEKEGLIAKPMTVATLAWGLLRNYLPREGVAKVVTDELTAVYKKAVSENDAETADAIDPSPWRRRQLTGGRRLCSRPMAKHPASRTSHRQPWAAPRSLVSLPPGLGSGTRCCSESSENSGSLGS